MENLLNIKNLEKRYSDFTLEDVSFEIPKGCIMGLVGENGAGKTTIIKSILNVIPKNKGEVIILGLDSEKFELEIKENIGVVLDDCFFHDNLDANNISLIMKNIYKSWDEDLFFSYLEKLNLPDKKIVKEFSKGMKMKLSIAAALAHRPQLLILDEPTSGLDPVSRSELLDIFLDFIQDEDKSILFSTHITSDLDKVADYITFIHSGKLVLSEEKFEIMQRHKFIKCSSEEFSKLNKGNIVGFRKNEFNYEVLLKDINLEDLEIKFVEDKLNLEDIMLYYIRGDKDERINN